MAACSMPEEEEESESGGTMPTMKELKEALFFSIKQNKLKDTLISLCLFLCVFLVYLLFMYVIIASLVQAVKQGRDDGPVMYSVELVGAKGIGSALDLGAESPAFKVLVHVDNGHVYGVVYGGGDLLISYAGVPLARGRIPEFDVETKKAVAVAVDAASYGLGIPEDLFRRMSQDRSRSGLTQLQVEFSLRYGGFFTCNVDLDTEHHVSHCSRHNFISST